MLVGGLEPTPPKERRHQSAAELGPAKDQSRFLITRWGSYKHYPIIYTVKIALTIAAMLFVLPGLPAVSVSRLAAGDRRRCGRCRAVDRDLLVAVGAKTAWTARARLDLSD